MELRQDKQVDGGPLLDWKRKRHNMVDALLAKIFGTKHEREVKRIRPKVEAINQLEAAMQQLSDAELTA
ncbi:MAG: hypothetical protein ACK6DX_11985, partial [Acidobacteriota bacterium]